MFHVKHLVIGHKLSGRQYLDVQSCALSWGPKRYHLVTWWNMKPFPVTRLLHLFRNFEETMRSSDTNQKNMSKDEATELEEALKGLQRECESCHLLNSADMFVRMLAEVRVGWPFSDVWKLLPEAMNRIEDECKRHLLMQIEPDYGKYFSNPQFFDPQDSAAKKVSVQFSSAGEDIAEAGKCLACGRSTACVMHLSRVLEVGLTTLANEVGVLRQNDWGGYLRGIDEELQRRFTTSGARTPDEQFYAECYAMFDSVRRAWRNPTMHVEKTYTSERAEEILVAVRSFMRHLSTKLQE